MNIDDTLNSDDQAKDDAETSEGVVEGDDAQEQTSSEKVSEEEIAGRVASEPSAETGPVAHEGKGTLAQLGKALSICTDQRMAHLDKGPVKAYKVISQTGKDVGNLFALVCEPHLVPRYKKINVFESVINPSLCSLVRHGVVFWPPTNDERYVFVYVDNWGKRLIEPDASQALGLKPELVIDKILSPMIDLLHDFRDRDFVHGSISPANIFDGGSSSFENMKLGDALSAPSFTQSVLYETVERGMADPVGRGQGTSASDIYSLGATISALVRSHDPTEGLTQEEIVRMKMDSGSFVALAGKDRFTGSILDFLRGTLHDDPQQRWGINEMIGWMDGQRLTPKQMSKRYKANRPLTFNSKKYLYPSHLAVDLQENPIELRKMVEDGELENWITRSIEKNKIYDRVSEAIERTREAGQDKHYEERLAANIAGALSPSSPVKYFAYSFFPDGVGSLLAQAFYQNKDLNLMHELVSQNVIMNWIRVQENPGVDVGALLMKFDSCRTFARQDKAGLGLERCLYLLNPDARCLSPILKEYYVLSSEDMMHAFEDICGKRKPSALLLDRHSMAFLLTRDSKTIEPTIVELRAEEPFRNVIGQLRTLAAIQKRHKIEALPNIAASFLKSLKPAYERIHDTKRQERIKESVERFAKEGDLVKMADVLTNPEVTAKDLAEFKSAMREYIDLSSELAKLEGRLDDKDGFGKVIGKETSAIISSMIAGVLMLITAFIYMTSGKPF